MENTAALARGTVAVSLVAAAALTTVSVALSPDFGDDPASTLRAIEDAGQGAVVSALTFTLAQLPLLLGVIGVWHLMRDRTPALATWGAALVVLSCFGHAVSGGTNLVVLAMAQDLAEVDVHVGVLAELESGVGVVFMAMGLLGMVIGFPVLALGLWRARVAPRPVPALLVGAVVVEFGLSALTDWAGVAAAGMLAAALVALAVTVWRSPDVIWARPQEVSDPVLVG